MKKIVSVLIALSMFGVIAPAVAADNVSMGERNVDWLLEEYEALQGISMDEEVTLETSGQEETLTFGEALDEFADRSERIDLEAVTSSEAGHSGAHVGDIWILGTTNGCPADNVLAPAHGLGNQAPDPQLFIYDEPFQQVSATGVLTVAGFTDKSAGSYSTAEIVGYTDNWCLELFGIGLYFPFINGVVTGE